MRRIIQRTPKVLFIESTLENINLLNEFIKDHVIDNNEERILLESGGWAAAGGDDVDDNEEAFYYR